MKGWFLEGGGVKQSLFTDCTSFHDLNFIHKMSIKGLSDDINFKVLVNNLFNSKYVSYGGYYTYDVPTDNQIKTYEGTYYYPQAEINILVGLDFKF